MASNIVNITVEDVATTLETYLQIQVYRAATLTGAYSLITTLTLDADTVYYSYEDTAGSLTSWYRYRFYNVTGPVTSDYSNPFRPDGSTRMKVRQQSMSTFKAGIVGSVGAGTTASMVVVSDYRILSSIWENGRGVGGWIKMTGGTYLGEASNIVGVDPSTGHVTISPAFSGAPTAGDQFEWHWLADPADWDVAFNEAMQRSYYLERLPLVGTGSTEMSLEDLVWLTNRDQICGLWYFPTTTMGERAWGSGGNWWSARQETARVTLLFDPAPDTSTTIYLEALRQMPLLYTDDSVLPNDASIDLLAALLYDEVLSILCQPTAGAARDVSAWRAARQELKSKIHKLRAVHGPHPRWQQPQLNKPSRVGQPWSAR